MIKILRGTSFYNYVTHFVSIFTDKAKILIKNICTEIAIIKNTIIRYCVVNSTKKWNTPPPPSPNNRKIGTKNTFTHE